MISPISTMWLALSIWVLALLLPWNVLKTWAAPVSLLVKTARIRRTDSSGWVEGLSSQHQLDTWTSELTVNNCERLSNWSLSLHHVNLSSTSQPPVGLIPRTLMVSMRHARWTRDTHTQPLLVVGQLYCRGREQQQFDLTGLTGSTYTYTLALLQVATNLREFVMPILLQTGLGKKISTKLPSLALLVSLTKHAWISGSEGVVSGLVLELRDCEAAGTSSSEEMTASGLELSPTVAGDGNMTWVSLSGLNLTSKMCDVMVTWQPTLLQLLLKFRSQLLHIASLLPKSTYSKQLPLSPSSEATIVHISFSEKITFPLDTRHHTVKQVLSSCTAKLAGMSNLSWIQSPRDTVKLDKKKVLEMNELVPNSVPTIYRIGRERMLGAAMQENRLVFILQIKMSERLVDKMIYEMLIFDILNEMIESHHQSEMEAVFDDNSDSEDDDEDLVLMEELKQALQVEEEELLMETLSRMYQKYCDVIRPYNQPFVTFSGSNRVTVENFSTKFPPQICRSLFRFEATDILNLVKTLQIPAHLSLDRRRTSSLEALLLLLRRLSSHCRYIDIAMEFDLRPQLQSEIFNGLIVFLFRKFGNHVRTIDSEWMSGRESLEVYADALQAKGCPLRNCVGWADGTHVPVCRPGGGLQMPFYCGHHKVHCFQALGLMTPSGMLAAFGPFDGSTHDAMAADIVGLDQLIEEHMTHGDNEYKLFLDAGYPIGRAMITPFRRIRSQSREELEWNRMMCRDRIAVEWGFAKLKNLFKMLTFKSNLKVRLSPVAMYFFVAVHLMNLHTCLYGSQIASYFGVTPPSVETYMATPQGH